MSRKTQTRTKILALRKETDKIATEYSEKVYTIVKQYTDNYNPNNLYDWEQGYLEVKKVIIECLEKEYQNVSSNLKRIYKKTNPFNLNNIEELAYKKDGKTLEQRLREHWSEAKIRLNFHADPSSDIKQEDRIKTRDYLVYHYDTIIGTEAKNVEETVKKNKKPLEQEGLFLILVIEGCGGDCNHGCLDYNGIYSPDDDVSWPPYHPNCSGIAYYDFTDDPDEIEEAGLEEGDSDESR